MFEGLFGIVVATVVFVWLATSRRRQRTPANPTQGATVEGLPSELNRPVDTGQARSDSQGLTSFKSAYKRLVSAFRRHSDAKRHRESFPAVVKTRFDLEDARVEARRSRTEADTQTEPGPTISRADISPESRAQLRMIGMRNIGEG